MTRWRGHVQVRWLWLVASVSLSCGLIVDPNDYYLHIDTLGAGGGAGSSEGGSAGSSLQQGSGAQAQGGTLIVGGGSDPSGGASNSPGSGGRPPSGGSDPSGGASNSPGSGGTPPSGGSDPSGGAANSPGSGGAPSAGSGPTSGTTGDAGAGGEPALCNGVCGSPNCGACPTNPMVLIHNDYFDQDAHIDATEVTNAAYAAFVDVSYDPGQQPPECTWNDSFVPVEDWPTVWEDMPVVYVDWCDAFAYCKWANKHLCGLFGGAPTGLSNFDAEANLYDEWYNACTGAKPGTDSRGHQRFPYGDSYVYENCNVWSGQGPTPPELPVASMPACEGGYPGIFDMAGNVAEFTNACAANIGRDDQCRHRGNSTHGGGGLTDCEEIRSAGRDQTRGFWGFRCCAD